jgi:hypothetical protein
VAWQTFQWELVSVFLALVALVVTIVIYFKTRKRKTLDYTLVAVWDRSWAVA